MSRTGWEKSTRDKTADGQSACPAAGRARRWAAKQAGEEESRTLVALVWAATHLATSSQRPLGTSFLMCERRGLEIGILRTLSGSKRG